MEQTPWTDLQQRINVQVSLTIRDVDLCKSADRYPVSPGSSFTYQFTAYPAGTYWYHSHNDGQYPDGLRGPMIVYDRPNYEDTLDCDVEYILTLSDW
jgi:hypothetical protein